MTQPQIKVLLDDQARVYRPGDVLSGEFSAQGVKQVDVRAIELSVLWHTEGKGDEDMAVHYFQRADARHGESIDLRLPQRFNTVLPNSPLSYGGMIVKICWCVRARVFLSKGKELAAEAPFQLGEIPRPQEVTP